MSRVNLVIFCGVRPQFIKAKHLLTILSRQPDLVGDFSVSVVDTGQHYSPELRLHSAMPKGVSVFRIEHDSKDTADVFANAVAESEKFVRTIDGPKLILVFGDATPALVGALCGLRLDIAVLHLEAGARRDPRELEDRNSRLVDALAIACGAVAPGHLEHLRDEGFAGKSVLVGDLSGSVIHRAIKSGQVTIHDWEKRTQILASIHRPQNCNVTVIRSLLDTVLQTPFELKFIAHPRVRDLIESHEFLRKAHCVDGLSHSEVLNELGRSRALISDSGGLLREAHYFRTPGLALRSEGGWEDLQDRGLLIRCDPEVDNVPEAFCRLLAIPHTSFSSTPFYNPRSTERAIASFVGNGLRMVSRQRGSLC